MKISERWLRDWVNPPLTRDELVHQLSLAGLEVDGVEPVAPDFTGVVVGLVTDVAPHPDADRLRVCQVETDSDAPVTVVCGAPNVYAGMRAPLAQVGGVLPDGMKIRRAKLRGVESHGMLCSAKELGLAETSDGLLELPGDAAPGADVRDVLALDDCSIEIDLTPNRSDCLSVAGIAREVGVLNGVPVQVPKVLEVPAVIDAALPVQVEAPQDCPLYLGRVIRGIDGGAETPLWMQERLRRAGLRSLGPVVDVTNYVLLELGQPLHGFDVARLSPRGIHVRRGHTGENLTLLDGRDVALDPDVLVIADADRPLALAGVMGGVDSGVTDETRDVFLESAYFQPSALAGRARRYGLHTDASHRFERGVEAGLQRRALERATALLLDIVGGEAGPISEAVHPEWLPERPEIRLRPERITRLLGTELPEDWVTETLTRLGLTVRRGTEDWRVVPPSFRFDLALEVDLIEELARVYGYDRLPVRSPRVALAVQPEPEAHLSPQRLRTLLVDRGYLEAITYSFVDPDIQALLDPEDRPIPLANPLSRELAVMRTSLWQSLLPVVRRNQSRQQERVRLFEIGGRFAEVGGDLFEEPAIAGVLTGTRHPEAWNQPSGPIDFFDIKGDVEALLRLTGQSEAFRFEAGRHPALHPGQTATVLHGDEPVGWLGALHPGVIKALDLQGPVLVFELRLTQLLQRKLPQAHSLARYPAVRRDLAVIVPEAVTAAALEASVRAAAGPVLEAVRIFDEYRGEKVEDGRKSIAFGLIFQEYSRTLTDQDVNDLVARIVRSLEQDLGAALRE